MNLLVGDFNVDFSRGGGQMQLLLDLMKEWDLSACDLYFSNSVHL